MTVDAKLRKGAVQAEARKPKGPSYLQQLKEELKKVTWTSRPELLFCTKVVLGSIFAFGVGIYLIDLVIKLILDGAGSLVRLLIG